MVQAPSDVNMTAKLQRCLSLSDDYCVPSQVDASVISTMSLDPPTYLNSLQNNIRARPIPWEGAVRAGTITDNDLKRIKAVDKVRKDQRRQTVEEDKETYKSLLLGSGQGKSVLESAAKRADVIQYILVLASDLINGTPRFARSLQVHVS